VYLLSLAALGTASADETAAEKKKKDEEYKKKILIKGSSKILHSNFEMPQFSYLDATTSNVVYSTVTYKDVIMNNPKNKEYCYQCVFSGGEWLEHC